MPRSGPNGTYTLPAIYLAIPGSTIVVDQHNTPLQDIANTFNTVQPIDYGGTGADNAADALANLGGASGAANEYVTATGTATAIVADPTTAIPTLITGRFVTFTAIADLTVGTGVTINVSGLGVRKLVKATDGGIERALAPGDMVTGGKYMAVYLSTLDTGTGAWVLVNPTPFYGMVRNRIVNPAMQISSVNGNSSGTANGYVPADNWATYRVTSAGVFTTQRVQSRTPKGSTDRIRVTITTADASLAAGEYLTITQAIFGNEIADFQYGLSTAQQTILQFGTKFAAGTYSFALHNAANDRSYVGQFTITAANTDEYFSFVIPGDTTGTWTTGSTTGLTLDVVIAAGSTFQGVTGWQAGNILGTASNTNGAGTISNVFELFDVQLTRDQDNLGVAPVWESPSYVGTQNSLATTGLVLLTSGTVSSAATLDIVLTSYTGYRGLVFELINFIPATDNTQLWLRVSTNGGSSYDAGASDYRYGSTRAYDNSDTATGTTRAAAADRIAIATAVGNGSSEGTSVTVKLMGQTNSAIKQQFLVDGTIYDSTDAAGRYAGVGVRNTAQDTDAVRFLFSSGNIASGSYAVYGYV